MMNLPRKTQHEEKPLEKVDFIISRIQVTMHETNVRKYNMSFSTRGAALALAVYPYLVTVWHFAS